MTDEFSVYAVVEPNALETAADVSELDGNMFYVSIDNNNLRYYAKNSLNGNCIAKTNASDISSAALYYFDAVEGTAIQLTKTAAKNTFGISLTPVMRLSFPMRQQWLLLLNSIPIRARSIYIIREVMAINAHGGIAVTD